MDLDIEETTPPYVGSSSPSGYLKPQHRPRHDPDVTFEEYHYYALKTREEQDKAEPVGPATTIWQTLFKKRDDDASHDEASPPSTGLQENEKEPDVNISDRGKDRLEVSDEEWSNASRMMRTATVGACFYLITTDILGPYGVGFAMGTLGWGPGIVSNDL
jgi:hypothetical protein